MTTAEAPRVRYRTLVWDSDRWNGFTFRDNDIVISTPPKCGTTWMQMQCALLLFRTPILPQPLAQLSPWLDMNTRPIAEVFEDLTTQTHRRFIKTHTPLDGLPWDERVTYLHVARDPRDVAMSWQHHLSNIDNERFIAARINAVGLDDLAELGLDGTAAAALSDDPEEQFWQWMEHREDAVSRSGLSDLVHHSATFWDRRDATNIHLFHYADQRADLAGQMDRLATALTVRPPTPDLVEAAQFDAMKARADELVPNSDTPFWKTSGGFFNRAGAGLWRDLIGDEALMRYQAALATNTSDAELIAWLHNGWGR